MVYCMGVLLVRARHSGPSVTRQLLCLVIFFEDLLDVTTLRSKVAFYEKDRFFAPDIEAAMQLLASRCLNELVPANVLPSL